ncbi:histidinol dehydrogenase [Campylobacter gastrosuis]|uniref:Histidinol dehydrogenase n=1 Tax=Campylobacter gastrosuis TaxID=2974576 RepID=A0ABT7HQP8_9BACT|nr:histidinol dehydrogenase [Campylobacter gastrosuis]MDL0089042.1 histidinol dehydrogenase [Campylobacter gastrosuis]
MRILNQNDENFKAEFSKLTHRSDMDMSEVTPLVLSIINEVKHNKNEALISQISRFDKWEPKSASELEISQNEMKNAYENLESSLKDALNLAFKRIKNYHELNAPKTWLSTDELGNTLGAKFTPVDRAGLYIPGGKAAYPSSLLMNAVPAIVANVGEIVVCTPAVGGAVNALLLAAMHLCGIKKAYKIGGASAIGAMAYGTQTIPKVDVITGPGNIYVATAKKLVFGDVNIDMIAGPSEIGIIADESANARHIAIDLLSQAEHDELASSFLITPSQNFAKSVASFVQSELQTLPRSQIASQSIKNKGAIIVAKNLDECVSLMNDLAVEHLELAFDDAQNYVQKIKHAGAIFIGHYTPEAMGDYLAGPNHTLPTGGSAKFYSPLGVENFMKKSSIIGLTQSGFNALADACVALANAEGLHAHARSVTARVNKA